MPCSTTTTTTYLRPPSTFPSLHNLLDTLCADASVLELPSDEPVTFNRDEELKLHVEVTLAVRTEGDWKGARLKRESAVTREGNVRNLVHEVTRVVAELADDVALARWWILIGIAEKSSLAEEFLEGRPDNHFTSFWIDRFDFVDAVTRLDLLWDWLEFGTRCKRCSKRRDTFALAA
jgi:hypothetical protein